MAKKKLKPVTLRGREYYAVNVPPGFDDNANRSKRYVRSEAAAKELLARVKSWRLNRKFKPETLIIEDAEKRWLAYLRQHVGDLSLLPEIVTHWQRTARIIREPVSVLRQCELFITYRESRPGSKRTLADMRHRCRKFCEMFGAINCHEITPAQVQRFVDSGGSPSSCRNNYKVLSVLFRYAKQQGSIVTNPLEEVERPESGNDEPDIYQPDHFRRLLDSAAKSFPDVVPFLALSGFAGVRSSELIAMYSGEETLQWPDVLWEKKLIVVRPEVSKTDRRRFVPMEPALIEWLTPCRKDSGSVVPFSESWFRKLLRGVKKPEDESPAELGLFRLAKVTSVTNGLRHSFASYWLARSGSEGVGRLAQIMGNSEAVARRHYVEVLEPGDGEAWFGIRR